LFYVLVDQFGEKNHADELQTLSLCNTKRGKMFNENHKNRWEFMSDCCRGGKDQDLFTFYELKKQKLFLAPAGPGLKSFWCAGARVGLQGVQQWHITIGGNTIKTKLPLSHLQARRCLFFQV
jgi:hypothetical protein